VDPPPPYSKTRIPGLKNPLSQSMHGQESQGSGGFRGVIADARQVRHRSVKWCGRQLGAVERIATAVPSLRKSGLTAAIGASHEA